jgi:hypothetical protein
VSQLGKRFGLQAMEPRQGGGPAVRYGSNERERILAEGRRVPDRERDGTATWSLSTLQRALRQAEDAAPIPFMKYYRTRAGVGKTVAVGVRRDR